MLFRCYSWESFHSKVNVSKEFARANSLDTNPQTLPSGDLIFCRFSFPLSLCIIKSRRIVNGVREIQWIWRKKLRDFFVVCKSLLLWEKKKEQKAKVNEGKSFEMIKHLMMKMFSYYFSHPNPQSNRLKTWHFTVT